ncbi:MAG: hypothetical protein WA459_09115 [Stellaceae bacterium]
MSVSSAIAYILLWGGLAIVMVLLALLLHGFDYFESDDGSEASHHQNRAGENQQQGDAVAAAITSYEQRRDTHERHRASREAVTIRVLTATGGFALLAAIAAFSSDWIFWGQLQEMNEEQRAWIAPAMMELDRQLKDGPPLLVSVLYFNTGKYPALDISHHEEGHIYNTPNGWDDWDNMVLVPNTTCDAIFPIVGRDVAYPAAGIAAKIDYRVIAEGKGSEAGITTADIIKDIIKRDRTFYVNGCFAYDSLGRARYSAYCFFLATDRDFPVEQWRFKNCPSGNWAK